MSNKAFIKLLAVLLVFMGTQISAQAQWRNAHISINGLTCSQCSRAVYNALKKVQGVQDVKMDLNSTTADITYRENVAPDPESLAQAVRKAGYAVGYIDLKYEYQESDQDRFEGFLCEKQLCVKMAEMPKSEGNYTIRLLGHSFNDNASENALIEQIASQPQESAPQVYYYGLLITSKDSKL